MRESIGTVSLLNFIIFFIFLVFAFLAGTFSYYKAYRVNNAMIAAIEKYEGFNDLSYKEMEQKLTSLGYQRVNFNCPTTKGKGKLVSLKNQDGPVANKDKGYAGYCIYRYANDSSEEVSTDQYDSYEVTTVITFQFPVIQDLLKLRVSARTRRIYNFEENCKAMGICKK